MDTLRVVAALAFVVAATALWWQARRTMSRGRSRVEAPARGRARDGVVYAFGRGMRPWAKESARQHPAVYAMGISYHLGVFVSLALAGLAIVGVPWLQPVWRVAAPLLGLSLAAGVGLLARRVCRRPVRAVSTPDDFASNVAVTLLVASALVSVARGDYAPSLLVVATVVFLYAPLGKIRHCVFFFLARLEFGRLLGRRGVLPGVTDGARS